MAFLTHTVDVYCYDFVHSQSCHQKSFSVEQLLYVWELDIILSLLTAGPLGKTTPCRSSKMFSKIAIPVQSLVRHEDSTILLLRLFAGQDRNCCVGIHF